MDAQIDEEANIQRIARTARSIAVVGMSPREDRPSWGVARYLQSQGFRIIPVNPGHAGERMLGETCYADLAAIPADAGVDMVDVFRRSDAVAGVVEQALDALPDLRFIWTQLGVRDDAAAEKARQRGVIVVQDKCPKIEFPRFL